MSYNRDLQEDKERLFDTVDTVRATVRNWCGHAPEYAVNGELVSPPRADPTLLATDLADYLVRKGIPFRKAHHVIGVCGAGGEGAQAFERAWTRTMRSVEKSFAADALRVLI